MQNTLLYITERLFFKVKRKLKFERDCLIIQKSSLFDRKYYLDNNPDVVKSGINPIKHYLLYGGFEGRNPSAEFNSEWYLITNLDVKGLNINPLLHYILHGKNECRSIIPVNETFKLNELRNQTDKNCSVQSLSGIPNEISSPINDFTHNQLLVIRESGLFDDDYYYSEYPDIKNAGINALVHYCLYGWKEGRNPNSTFETYYYLSVNKDVKESGLNPLYHYIITGSKEGRQSQFINLADKSKKTFEFPKPFRLDVKALPVKTIAFYLPQFHPIPENDEWWGKNFTEWTNVTKAKPQFEGHYQPHLPVDLGFYDLRIPDVMQQQIEIAKNFGIYGFCFYYYCFGGKRLLEKPLDMFLQHKEWNFNFCICWANENWTRRWDGQEKDILIAQIHSKEDDIAFIENIAKYIDDPRYIKVDNKPLVIIYQPQLFPEIKSTVKRWREHYKIKYGGDIYLTMVQTFGKCDPGEFDFDAAIEFPPHNIEPDIVTNIDTNLEFIGTIHDARSLIKKSKYKLQFTDYELFRGVMLTWDNTARKGRKSNVFVNNEPNDYKAWIENAIEDTVIHKKDVSKRLVFINAWNEWAEGTHLEPDQKYGYAYLNATSRALELSIDIKNELKIGILIHAFYLDVLPELLSYIDHIKVDFTILISVPIGKRDEALAILKNHAYTNYILKEVENIGFDIAPMFCSFQKEIFDFDLICKIHTKKSTHNRVEFGIEWRRFCLDYLLRDENQTAKIIKEFNLNKDLGIIYPQGFPPVMDWIKRNGANFKQIEKILPEILIPNSYKNLIWPVGSFFWFRPESLKPIFEENFTLEDFKPTDYSLSDENGITRDLSLAHSLERIFCYISRISGYKTSQIIDTIIDDKLTFEKSFIKKGFCPVCNTQTIFFSPDDWFRDHYHCKHCNSIPRNRAIFHVLNSIDKDWKLKRLHESSPNNRYFADVVNDYTYSQFYPNEVLGEIIDGNRNENLEKLTFQDEEFDYFITLDVMEHVFNPDEAIKEMLRATKNDGAVVFTVPIHKHLDQTIQRAKLDKNNRVEYLLPEYYHGNPVGNGKSLVTWDYGQDYQTLVQNWIGKYFEIRIFKEPVEEMGIIGDYLEVIVISKLK